MSTALGGCFAWSYVEQGYDNFSAYFNTFYNASQLFDEAMKDVADSKRAYDLGVIAGDQPVPFTISKKAKDDFNEVIAKGSKVLQYHPHSEFTEDCLFMIGVGYYYQDDYLRGDRKFLEIESKFPNTKRLAEDEMYYGGLQLNGAQNETGMDRLRHAIRLAKEEKKPTIVAQSSEIIADYYLKREDTSRAASYLDTASVFSKNDQAAIYACRAGNLYASINMFPMAEKEFKRAKAQAKDVKVRFYSVYYLARVHRLLHQYYLALDGLKTLRGDDKYYDFFPLIDYQEATALYDSGEVSTAVTAYTKIDTANKSDPAATRSAYRLANIYLYLVGDFQNALKYYQRVGSHPKVYAISEEGQEMAKTLQNYLITSYKVLLEDSLYNHAIRAVENHDTTVSYSASRLDSLYEHAADARDQLAGAFMFKLQMPDSAIRAYKIILNDFKKSRVYPSALYTLGEYYYSSGDTVTGRKYLEELVSEYKDSPYAVSAFSVLGKPAPDYVDSSQVRYSKAISLTKEGKYSQAVDTLRILVENRKSKLTPQALYTVGWIYENKLEKPDSAFRYYRRLSKEFPSSDYSQKIRLAVTGYEAAERDSALVRKMRADSVSNARKEKLDSTGHNEKSSKPAGARGQEPSNETKSRPPVHPELMTHPERGLQNAPGKREPVDSSSRSNTHLPPKPPSQAVQRADTTRGVPASSADSLRQSIGHKSEPQEQGK